MENEWTANIAVDSKDVEKFCELWGILRIDVYGSVLSGRFSDRSDIDVIVEFDEDVPSGCYRLEAASALGRLFGRNVDMCTFEGLLRSENRAAAEAILKSGETIYVSK